VNKYYWKIKTSDSQWFYTTNDNDPETLDNIFSKIKIRSSMIDDFFEHCLISHVTGEDISLMNSLHKGHEVTLNSATIRTQDYYTILNGTILRNTDCDDSNLDDNPQKPVKTPDLHILFDGKQWIIDAYNGSELATIKKKLNSYVTAYRSAEVFVFSSGIAQSDQLSKSNATFALYTLINNEVKQVKCIDDCPFTINTEELNRKYYKKFRIFKVDVLYWLNCHKQGVIIKSIEQDEE
jgi:hypothetical protein